MKENVYIELIKSEIPKSEASKCFLGAWYHKVFSSTDFWEGIEGVIILPEVSLKRFDGLRNLDVSSIYMGGTDLKYGIIDINSNLITKGSVSTHAKEGGRAILDQIVEIYNNHKNDYNIKGIAISSAGVVDPNTTIILDATNTITNFIGLNIREYLNEKLGNINISVENDVNCMALCEAFKGSGVNAKSMAAMTIGTFLASSTKARVDACFS